MKEISEETDEKDVAMKLRQ